MKKVIIIDDHPRIGITLANMQIKYEKVVPLNFSSITANEPMIISNPYREFDLSYKPIKRGSNLTPKKKKRKK